ncbi:Transposable element P transposase [Orchesella cincta]|uniref:Transposable element P transposase n=1 Tax=Orchesella cincta TaxID=48709 RepID=A0A1D2MTP7_ORCCI|nr:Transposable element P transposase [Orchesella cincta]
MKEMKLTHKLGQKHVNIRGQLKQNVRTAFQIFSHSTATAIRTLLKHRSSYEEVADFFDMVNDLSDLLNTRFSTPHYNKFKCPYGMHLTEQNALLMRAHRCFSSMKVGYRKSKTYAPFQKGLLWNIQSHMALYEHLKSKLERFEFILTARDNQDFLENLFSVMRSYGGQNQNPTPVEFRYRMRKLILTWGISCGDMDESSIEFINKYNDNISNATDEDYENEDRALFGEAIEEELAQVEPYIEVRDYVFEELSSEKAIHEGGKEYMCGYMAKKLFKHVS